MQLDLCMTVFLSHECDSKMLILIAESPESYHQWLKLLRDMTGTVDGDIGVEYVAAASWQSAVVDLLIILITYCVEFSEFANI